MDFSRDSFVAFSQALGGLYSGATPDLRIGSFLKSLRCALPACQITTSTTAPEPLPDGISTSIELPVCGAAINVVISNPDGLSLREQFIADRLRIHLQTAFESHERKTIAPEPADARRARALGLTPRECEVLQWLMAGKRDAEIASHIGAAERTVNKHVENILRKLGAETRAGAAHAAAERLPRIPNLR